MPSGGGQETPQSSQAVVPTFMPVAASDLALLFSLNTLSTLLVLRSYSPLCQSMNSSSFFQPWLLFHWLCFLLLEPSQPVFWNTIPHSAHEILVILKLNNRTKGLVVFLHLEAAAR